MEILKVIQADHESVLEIFGKMLKETKKSDKRKDLLQKLQELLLPHMHAEENLFYPFLKQEGEDPQPVLEAYQEHLAARLYLDEVMHSNLDDENWIAKITVLHELINHHIEEEEEDLFRMAEEKMDEDQAEEMGEKFEELKKEAQVPHSGR